MKFGEVQADSLCNLSRGRQRSCGAMGLYSVLLLLLKMEQVDRKKLLFDDEISLTLYTAESL